MALTFIRNCPILLKEYIREKCCAMQLLCCFVSSTLTYAASLFFPQKHPSFLNLNTAFQTCPIKAREYDGFHSSQALQQLVPLINITSTKGVELNGKMSCNSVWLELKSSEFFGFNWSWLRTAVVNVAVSQWLLRGGNISRLKAHKIYLLSTGRSGRKQLFYILAYVLRVLLENSISGHTTELMKWTISVVTPEELGLW